MLSRLSCYVNQNIENNISCDTLTSNYFQQEILTENKQVQQYYNTPKLESMESTKMQITIYLEMMEKNIRVHWKQNKKKTYLKSSNIFQK